jgi:hypothetical protein
MIENQNQNSERLLRRAQAARYVVETYNVSLLAENAGEACLCKLRGASVPTRRTISPLPSLRARRMGPEENRASGPIDVRGSARRLINKPPNENPAARSIFAGSARAPGSHGVFYVKKYIKPIPHSHQLSGLPLFDWRHVTVRPATSRAGQYVMRRYGLPIHTAEVIAALAGLGSEVSR